MINEDLEREISRCSERLEELFRETKERNELRATERFNGKLLSKEETYELHRKIVNGEAYYVS